VIDAVPAATPVTSPLPTTVASSGALLDQVTVRREDVATGVPHGRREGLRRTHAETDTGRTHRHRRNRSCRVRSRSAGHVRQRTKYGIDVQRAAERHQLELVARGRRESRHRAGPRRPMALPASGSVQVPFVTLEAVPQDSGAAAKRTS